MLIDHFLKMFSTRHDRNVSGISGQAYRMLLAHNWPGNIRELENVIERAVIMCQRGEMIEVDHFPQSQLAEATKRLMQLDEATNEKARARCVIATADDRNKSHRECAFFAKSLLTCSVDTTVHCSRSTHWISAVAKCHNR